MVNTVFLEKLSNNLNNIIKNSPVSDAKKNIDALIQGVFAKMELISREEFDIQAEVLKTTRDKLETCEKKLAEIEQLLQKNND